MATPGQLVSDVAGILGIPERAVAHLDRQLAEAGLRTSGGRGRSAARVTSDDAANLLISILGAPVLGSAGMSAADTCQRFGAMKPSRANMDQFAHSGLVSLSKLPSNHSFQQAISTLIRGVSEGEYLNRHWDNDDDLLISVQSDIITAEISLDRASVHYSSAFEPPEGDLTQIRQVTFRAFRLLGPLLGKS